MQRGLRLEGKAGYSCEVDCWAIGVLTYECLVGKVPYDAASMDEMLELIDKTVGFSHQDGWSGLSQDAQHFISRCLDADPSTRITALEMLSHPWIVDLHHVRPPSPSSRLGFHAASTAAQVKTTSFSFKGVDGRAPCHGGGGDARPISPSFGGRRRGVELVGGRWRAMESEEGEGEGISDSPPSPSNSLHAGGGGLKNSTSSMEEAKISGVTQTLVGRFRGIVYSLSSTLKSMRKDVRESDLGNK